MFDAGASHVWYAARERGAAAERASYVLTVGAHVRDWYGGGLLIVRPGVITLEPDRIMRWLTSVASVVHTSPKVTMMYARFAPPWINTSVVVESPTETATAGTWWPARRRLRQALQAAGFEVEEVRTAFSLGDDRVTPPWER
jgi:hypothetical protein